MVSTRSSSLLHESDGELVELPQPTRSPQKKKRTNGKAPAVLNGKTNGHGHRHEAHQDVWYHQPTPLTLLWLIVSTPLFVWDTMYTTLRPHTMPEGFLHWPFWVPYALYGTIDLSYGPLAIEEENGFTAAQGTLNIIELGMAFWYLYLWAKRGIDEIEEGERAKRKGLKSWMGEKRVHGREGALMALIGFSSALMTFYKTVLYWLNEYFGGFHNIGHNSRSTLIFLWIIPNGVWFIGTGYMIVTIGKDILRGLELAGSKVKAE